MIAQLSTSVPQMSKKVDPKNIAMLPDPNTLCSHYFSLVDTRWSFCVCAFETCRTKSEQDLLATCSTEGPSLQHCPWPPDIHCEKPQLESPPCCALSMCICQHSHQSLLCGEDNSTRDYVKSKVLLFSYSATLDLCGTLSLLSQTGFPAHSFLNTLAKHMTCSMGWILNWKLIGLITFSSDFFFM